ncbi:putative ribonuclease H protein, partial [Trifolium medium]|nr:putative ribonuclease H protein [Trifolium medium]
MQIKAVECPSKYLGLPAFVGRSKQQVFNFVQDRVWKKLKGWKWNHMSYAAREVLIKAVVQSIPTYVMSCFKLPDSLCDHIESMISMFWWGSKHGERKIHWVAWKYLCKEKKEGGMGFRTIKEFNLAMLAKQGWRFLQNEESLLTRCLKGRYFPRSNFLHATLGYNPSYTWRSIFLPRLEIIDHAGLWKVGDGQNIKIWEDNWLPLQQAQQITQIPLSFNRPPDCFMWGANKAGVLSVRSAYKFLKKRYEVLNSNQSIIPQGSSIWSKLWKIKTIPRHLQLMWRIIHNRLPVREVLFKRGVNCPPLCCLCDGANESIDHLFLGCDWTKTVWFASDLGVNFSACCEATISFSEWVSKVIMHQDIEVVQLVLSICYEIWSVRNTRCFEGADLPNALSCWNNAHKSI